MDTPDLRQQCDLTMLAMDYAFALAGDDFKWPAGDEVDYEWLRETLVSRCDWTDLAARMMCQLVRDYGSFVLRNAAALAIALKVEDGELGF